MFGYRQSFPAEWRMARAVQCCDVSSAAFLPGRTTFMMLRQLAFWLILAGLAMVSEHGGRTWHPCNAAAPDQASRPAGGWPQFRGPDGQGHVPGPIPTSWKESGVNLLWSIDVPGKGWSSPVILDGKVWMTTAVAAPSGDYALRAIAVDEESGKIRHDIELFTVNKPAPKTLHDRNTFASPTPVLEKGRLYAHFGRYGTACVDTTTGRILWKNATLIIDHETGPASSPALYKDRLICPFDGCDRQFAVALSTATGDVLWKAERPEAADKSESSRRAFSTPLIISVAGKDQVVIPGAFCVYCYDPLTGEEIWRVRYGGYSNVPRPVFAHGLVYVCSGFTSPDLLAIRPDGHGDVTKTHVVWRQRKNVPNVPSPVVVGERLFMVADKGIATALEAKTGKVLWSERLAGTFAASLLAFGNTLYAFDENGKTFLFEAADSFKDLGHNELKGRVQASPAVDNGCLFVRTDQRLVKVGTMLKR
jgi:outer membrane protein assembly factor BamB